ncbi:MAG TPA: PEGA domain-containing protein [Polyangiaceae bacterium]|jgi:hypothetical protein
MAAGIIAGALALSSAGAAGAAPPDVPAKPDAAAAPQPDLNAAKKLYADGERKFKAMDYAGAVVDFRAANEIKSTPQAERYIGICEDKLGHFQEATSFYDKFLVHVPDKMGAQGDELRRRETEIRAMPGKIHIESNPAGATVTIDGAEQSTHAPLDVDLNPGPHTIHLAEDGRLPADKQLDVTFASTQTLTVDLEAPPPPPEPPPPPPPPVAEAPPPAPPPPPPPPPPPRSKVPAYITGGLAVVAAGVGTAFGVMALNDKSDFDKNPTSATADDGDTHALIADMAFGVALTFGVTSAVLLFTKDEPPAVMPSTAGSGVTSSARTADTSPGRETKRKDLTVTPTPWVGAHGGGAGVVVRF